MVNYNVRFTKMKLSHNWKLFGLLVSLTHLANGQVVFDLQGTSCKSEDITLGCTISSFTTDATWKRGDGSVLAVTCSSAGPCSQVSQTIDGTTYSFQGNTSGVYMSTQLPLSEHGVNWTCTYSSNDYIYQFELGCSEVTTEGSTEGNQPCEGSGTAYLQMIPCSVGIPIVKILIILWLWWNIYCKRKPDTVIPLKPIGKNCRVAVTAKKTFKSATWKIQKKVQQPMSHLKNRYTIDVCEGQLLECRFATDAGVLELSLQNKGDLLHVKPDQSITLPTLLKVNPMFSTVKWRVNERLIPNVDLQFITKVTSSTCGTYDIEMTFKEHKIIIWIQNIIVKESKGDETDSDESTEDEEKKPKNPRSRGWLLWLLIICVVVDLFFALLGGGLTGWKRSTDGYCVEVKDIIILVVVCFVVFTIVELFLIWFLMIKRTGDEKGSRGAMSASDGDQKTFKNQNGPNWQPPNYKDSTDASQ